MLRHVFGKCAVKKPQLQRDEFSMMISHKHESAQQAYNHYTDLENPNITCTQSPKPRG
jgi:hypothetical protein